MSMLIKKDNEFLTHISVEGLKRNVIPGMTADVSIIVGKQKNALLVPVSGLSNGHLLIKRDDKKRKVLVKIGGVDGDWAEVLDGDILESDLVLIKEKKGL